MMKISRVLLIILSIIALTQSPAAASWWKAGYSCQYYFKYCKDNCDVNEADPEAKMNACKHGCDTFYSKCKEKIGERMTPQTYEFIFKGVSDDCRVSYPGGQTEDWGQPRTWCNWAYEILKTTTSPKPIRALYITQ